MTERENERLVNQLHILSTFLPRPHRPRPPSRADARGAVATLTLSLLACDSSMSEAARIC